MALRLAVDGTVTACSTTTWPHHAWLMLPSCADEFGLQPDPRLDADHPTFLVADNVDDPVAGTHDRAVAFGRADEGIGEELATFRVDVAPPTGRVLRLNHPTDRRFVFGPPPDV